LIAADDELTMNQAARLLGISRLYLVRLIDRGAIPCHSDGTHQWAKASELLAYKRRHREGVQRLARLSEELGLYE
jgi:excisionase family DNA binding protein